MTIKFFNNVEESYASYLEDEAHLLVGNADRIYFPKNIVELISIVIEANQTHTAITISGGGTGLAGGRVPLGGWIIATDNMRSISGISTDWKDPESQINYQLRLEEIDNENALLTVPAAMTTKSVQNYCRDRGWFYPPDPTELTGFISGNTATNASGARSFKFGATRSWVERLLIILPKGKEIALQREEPIGNSDNIRLTPEISVSRPRLNLPKVKKNVSSPVITDDSHPLDLFIGSGGMYGIIGEVTLRLIKPPSEILSIFTYCDSMDQAINLVERLRERRDKQMIPFPMTVEYLDNRAANIMREKDSNILISTRAIVFLEQDIYSDEELETTLEYLEKYFDELGIENSSVAQSHKEIEHHKYLRHIVPETVNSMAKSNGFSKLGTDYSVPDDKYHDLMNYIKEISDKFEEEMENTSPLGDNVGYAMWSHSGDSHFHLNLLPRSDSEYKRCKEIFVQLMEKVVELGGSIAAEHGLGKKEFNNKPAIYIQHPSEVVAQLIRIKRELDPKMILNRGNIIGVID
jgi:D-lactate dehydrogenase (cytochrome)